MSSTKLNIKVLKASVFGQPAAKKYNVGASATLIYPGEPVARALGGIVVTPMATNKPVVGTDYLAGIAMTTSTNTAGAAGEVWVEPIAPGTIYVMAPNSATAWDTQAEYDALVGKRVVIDLTTGNYTILATDSANNGCVIEWMDVAKFPNQVAFSFREALSDTE